MKTKFQDCECCTHTHNSKAKFKLLLVFLIFFLFLKTNSEAQSSCQNAILVIPNDSVYIMKQSDTVYWGAFYADSQYLTLRLEFAVNGIRDTVSNLQLFTGTCSALDEIYVVKNADNYGLFAENLIEGNYYIVKISKGTTASTIGILLDTRDPVLNCNSQQCNDNISLACDLVCNGNFEFYTPYVPNGSSQIGLACPWGSVNDANPDYYNGNSTHYYSDVPDNGVGSQNSYNYLLGDKGYAGFGINSDTSFCEYLFQKLKAPMLQGVTYNIQMKVSRGDFYKYAANNIGIFLSASNPYFGTGYQVVNVGPVNYIPSQTLIYNNYITDATGWTTINFTYTPQIAGIQYITIGGFGNTNLLLCDNNARVYGCQYYIDEVHITPSNTQNFTITANPNPICSGNLTNITNSLNLPLNWSSNSAGTFSCPTACSSTNFTTSSQATVTGTYSIAPNCNSTASTIVNYIAPIKPIVTGKFNTCDLTSLYTITNPQAGTTYSWSILPSNCGSLSPSSGANVNITWNPSNFPAENYASIIITSSNGCTNRDTIKVWKCCFKNGTLLHDQTITSTLAPGIYFLNGTINFSGTFSNSDLILNMSQEAKIIINSSSGITFNNTEMNAGCDYMWDGITVNQGATITVNNSEIRNAFNAITSVNGARFTLYNTVFNKNLYGVNVKSYSGTHTGSVSKCTFKSTIVGGDTPENLIIPYSNRRGIAGMIIQGVNNITVGNTASTTNTNTFKNMDYGVYVENSNVTFYNNAFGPFPYTSGWLLPENGYGIYANKSGFSGNILNIGSTIDNSVYKNSFTSCAVGVRSNSSYSLNVNRNIYTDNTLANMITDDYSRNINYTYNNFAKGTVGIWVNNFVGTSVNVSNNTMDNVPNGIMLSNNTLTPVTSINITNNLIQMGLNPLVSGGDLINGIGLSNVQGTLQSRPYIYNNDIKFNSVNLSVDQVRNGIQVSNSPFSMVELNRISYRNLPIITSQANRLNGINVILSTNTILCSNELKHLANGVRIEGYSDRSQFILNNFIRFNNATGSQSYGFRFESATIGVQGTSTRTWDNTFNTINFPTNQNKRGWGSMALQQQWNFRGGALNQDYWFDYPSRQQSVLNAMSRTYIPVPPSCGFQGYDFMNGMAGENEMSVETESDFLENNDENQYFKLYTMVNNDVSSSESEHYAVSNISSNIGSENISKFLAVNRLVNERLFNSADSLNQLIEPENLIEKNMQTVNEIYLRTWAKGNYNFSLEDYTTLVDIAMQTPKTSGYGVIGAWVMVGRFDNNQETEKFSNNKISIISNNILMYPNPATSQLSFEGVEAVSSITIHDVMGRLVLNIDNKQLDNAISISINDLKKGIYIVSFTNDFGEKIGFEKLIIN